MLFHLIQPARHTRARALNTAHTYYTHTHIRTHRASVTEIAPVRDSFVPRALSLSARFIRTRIDISPLSANPLGLSPFGTSFTLFRSTPIQLRRGVARSLAHFMLSIRTCTKRPDDKDTEERSSLYVTRGNYFI